ncbi:MAG: SDR family NAD(P)-dependent oxidoreductase [Proteobacteria bacterium]|nr:SDR family NAD(P)-dependent oxidoreductase [Pseudomonadota bacterium]
MSEEKLDIEEGSHIAIIGMAGRFPGASDVTSYWKNLRDGVEALTALSDQDLEAAGVDRVTIDNPSYVKIAGVLDEMEQFDAGFFGFSPRDAAIMDPQHRHFLECSWEAFEDAAIDPDRFEGTIGVFAGSGHNAYMPYNLLTNPSLVESVGFFLLRHTGNDKDFMTTRVSYLLKLTGPSINIQTACSTSLVATHVACQSLLNGECDMALAGGVTIEMPHRRGYMYEEGEILSPDGHCRAFDSQSKGTVFGSGTGVVVLRRLEDAVADGDYIRAVIRGSAVNNDGAMKVGYLAPSVEGQSAAISEALALADIDPRTITYVETHGTGTPVGDPIEIAAMTQAFGDTDDKQFCGIGSVKTNIGHLDTAAGVASLIKAVCALEHGQLPPSLHFDKPNPVIDFANSPFYVNATLSEWKTDGTPRRAGVNSLGVGGTNAFVVVEEAPEPAADASGDSRPWQLILHSARSSDAVDAATGKLSDYLADNPDAELADVAYTLQVGRRAFPHRRMLVARDAADAREALASRDPQRLFTQAAAEDRSVAFLFPGGGAQYPNMGREIYQTEATYRAEVDRCLELLSSRVDYDLKALLFPEPDRVEEAAAELQKGSRALPALFITEYALARLFMSWGVQPAAMLGHSMGEYVAACLAGVFTADEGLALVVKRGQLFETIEAGTMLSVPLGPDELKPYLADKLDIAAVNGPTLSVASGPVEAIDQLAKTLEEREIDARRVRIEVAAHSRMLDPILAEFRKFTGTIDFQPPSLPFLSNVSGTWITESQATDPQYWVDHLRSTVQFADNLQALLEDSNRVILEVAPGRTLSTLAKAHPAAGLGRPVFNSLRHPKEDVSDMAFLLNVVGRLWLTGVDIDWKGYHADEKRRRIPLPTYPFEHQRYWIEPGKSQVAPGSASMKKKSDLADWFYQQSWQRSLLPETPASGRAKSTPERWLIFADDAGFGEKLGSKIPTAGADVITVTIGREFARSGENAYSVRPGAAGDYDALISDLVDRDRVPDTIVHLWCAPGGDSGAGADASRGGDEKLAYKESQERGFYSLLFLLQALAKEEHGPIELGVVTSGMQQVAGEQLNFPERATILGPVKVAMQEFPNLTCRSIDIAFPVRGAWQEAFVLEQVAHEMATPSHDHVIAYRGTDRFVQTFEATQLPKASHASERLRDGGVYLITGGTGGIGLVLAEHLAKTRKAKLVLVSRSGLGDDERKAEKIRQLEAAGAEVVVAAADVTNLEQMHDVVKRARDRFGAIQGVFHTAGVLDDGVIQLKDAEAAERVLAPKVRGTLVLDRVVADDRLDFMVLFSSVSSFTGLAGQVDYSAANGFIDAFARARTQRDGTFAIAVNWNAWQEVGMAAEMARELGIGPRPTLPEGTEVPHPLLDRRLGERPIYASLLTPADRWILDEHRIKGGSALIPGTGFVELARAAFVETEAVHAHRAIEIRDLFFLAPFAVADGDTRQLRVTLEPAESGYEVEIADPDGEVSARGVVRHVDKKPPDKLVLAEIAARCTARQDVYDSAADENLDFGPRWNNRTKIQYGDGEALVTLALPGQFAADCEHYQLHPALMDFATAGAQRLIRDYDPQRDFYVPMSYGTLTMYRGLTPEVCSRVRYRDSADKETAVFDITITDPGGEVLVEIDEFVMRYVPDRAAMTAAVAATVEQRKVAAPTATGNKILELGLAEGILPAEGMDAIERILAAPQTTQLIVSSQDLNALMASTQPAEAAEGDDAAGKAGEAAGTRVSRPPLANPYVAPESELETQIAQVWEELLGVDGVGIHDDFFDLGGHSLLLTQLASRVRKRVKVDISLRRLFEKRTVAGIAGEIQSARESGSEKKAPTLKRVSRDAYRVKRPKQ